MTKNQLEQSILKVILRITQQEIQMKLKPFMVQCFLQVDLINLSQLQIH
jgi:hypothetical protein